MRLPAWAYKSLWPALLLAAAGLYLSWKQGEAPPVGSAAPVPATIQPELASLEQRLAVLEERVHTLEGELNNGSRFSDSPDESNSPERVTVFIDPAGPDLVLRQIQQDFENDDHAGDALRRDLENVAPLFDAEEISSLTFRTIDCRTSYCRLEYEDTSTDRTESMITENELFLLLSQKYGQDIVIHGGESSGRSRSLYVELHPN